MARQSDVSMSAGWKANWGVDQHDLTGQGNDLEHDRSTKEIEGKGFGKRALTKQAGQQDGDVTIKGLYASGEKLHGILTRRYGRTLPCLLWYGLEGTAHGAAAVVQPSRLTSYKTSTKTDDPCEYDSKWSADGDIWDGHVYVSPDSLLSGATYTSGVIDNTDAGGETTAGGVLFFAVWALNGDTAPTLVAVLQGSDDDGATWDDLLTTEALSAKGYKFEEAAAGATWPELLRVTLTATGTPTSYQCLAIGARGIDPDDPNLV